MTQAPSETSTLTGSLSYWTSPWLKCLYAAALIAAVFFAYQPAWHGAYIWDDGLHLLNNPVLQPGGMAITWTPPCLADWLHTSVYINYWPLTFTVYRLEYELWGKENPLYYHLVNLALHAGIALLIWRVLVELEIPGAMLGAALFALHPVNVEGVAWIAQLKGLLSLLFGLVSTLCYLQFDRKGSSRLYAAAIGAFVLSVLAKGMVITLPIVLLACVWWRRGSIQSRDLRRMIPYLVIGAIMTGMEFYSQQLAQDDFVVRNDGLVNRTAIAGRAVWFYLGKLFWPSNLSFVYPRWNLEERDPLSLIPTLLLLALFAVALWRRRTWGAPVVLAVVCYIALLLPALGFVNIYFMRYSLVADHWQYAAAIVPCAAVAAVGARLFQWLGSRDFAQRLRPALGAASLVLSLAILAVLADLTWRQSQIYTHSDKIWTDTLAKNPNCVMALNNLGSSYLMREQFDQAIAYYDQVLKIDPNSCEAFNNLGFAFDRQGKKDEAIAMYRESLHIKPDFVEALDNLCIADPKLVPELIPQFRAAVERHPKSEKAHNSLGLALMDIGQMDKAIEEFERAIELKSYYLDAHFNLGRALLSQARLREATVQFQKVVETNPKNVEAHFYLANALVGRQQLDDAEVHYRKVIELEPSYNSVHANLGNVMVRQGRLDEAIGCYRNELKLWPNSYQTRYNLGLTFAQKAQFLRALEQFQKALDAATAAKDTVWADKIQDRMTAVRQESP